MAPSHLIEVLGDCRSEPDARSGDHELEVVDRAGGDRASAASRRGKPSLTRVVLVADVELHCGRIDGLLDTDAPDVGLG